MSSAYVTKSRSKSKTNHQETCPQRLITCPNHCSTKQFKQVNLPKHRFNCPSQGSVQVSRSPHNAASVMGKTIRKDSVHEEERLLEGFDSEVVELQGGHISLQSLVSTTMLLRQQVEELSKAQHQAHEQITSLKQEVGELKRLLKENQEKFQRSSPREPEMVSSSVASGDIILTNELKSVREKCVAETVQTRLKLQTFRYFVGMLPLEFTLRNFAALKKSNGMWHSQPFYSHPAGYRLFFYVYPNGKDDAVGTHMSLYFSLKQGEFDDFLKWPFHGEIILQLLDQTSTEQHATRKIAFDDKTPDNFVSKPEVGKQNGWGTTKFIELKGEGEKHLQNDSLKFCVVKVKVLV